MGEKKPNAANITHGLAQLGGGSKKDGGGGMMAGIKAIFNTGVEVGAQTVLSTTKDTDVIDEPIEQDDRLNKD